MCHTFAIESGLESLWVLGPKYTKYVLYQAGEEGIEMGMGAGICIIFHLRNYKSLTMIPNNSPKILEYYQSPCPKYCRNLNPWIPLSSSTKPTNTKNVG